MTDNLIILKQQLLGNPNAMSKAYMNYALALTCYELKQYDEAREHLAAVGQPNNMFVVDLQTDLDLATGNKSRAVERLQGIYRSRPNNEAVAINLGNALIESGRNQEAVKVLKSFNQKQPDNYISLQLLGTAYGNLKDRCNSLQIKAYQSALGANYNGAVQLYSEAINTCKDSYSKDMLRARIAQVREQKRFDEDINNSMR